MVILAAALILLGIAGAVLPFLPGPPLALAGLIIYGVATDFRAVSVTAIVVFSLFTILTLILDVVAPALGAKGYKASRAGVIGAFAGAVFGMFVLGPLGVILGPFFGGFIGEMMSNANAHRVWRAAWGAFVGFLLGTVVRLGITLAMAGYFVLALFR